MMIRNKLHALRASRILERGGCVAHATATLSGIAADPSSKQGIQRLQCFKQRQGPFLLLADCVGTALRQARYISPTLRQLARSSWPGALSLIIPAKPGLDPACYQKTSMAIRVDVSEQTRALAKARGGLLLSSSLNRKSQTVQQPHRKTQMHFRPFLNGRLVGEASSGNASKIMRVWRNTCTTMRA